ncbi:M61 family metallopeptidase [Lysobacter terrae]
MARPVLLRPSVPCLIALLLACAGPVAAADTTATRVRIDQDELRSGDHVLHLQIAPDIDPDRARMLRAWLAETAQATLAAYGRFPLPDATIRVSEVDGRSSSPVPWGQTSRRGSVAVLLFVRKDASLGELRADWTAVHELSHLFHPYLGDDGRWLAEGLASYYQNVLRARSGLLDEAEAWRRLDAGFGRGRREDSGMRLDELSGTRHGTMRVYWAGAAYWLETDLALRERGGSLDAVLSRYADCCLSGSGEVAPAEFIAQLDQIAGGDAFTRTFQRYSASREFPSLDAAYAKLGLTATTGGLRFSDRAQARRLREAVMGRR